MVLKFFYSIIILLVLSINNAVYAEEFQCSGSACDEYILKYKPFLLNFQEIYLNALAKDMIVAQGGAGFSPIPGYVNLDTIALGFTIGGAFTETRQISIRDEYNQKDVEINETGIALTPSIYAGMNAGYLINEIYNTYLDIVDCNDSEELERRGIECRHSRKIPFLSKFDIYVYGIKYGSEQNNDLYYQIDDPVNNPKAYIFLRGAMIRFHLIEEKSLNKSISWLGVSAGGGWHKSVQHINITFTEKHDPIKIYNEELQWYGRTIFSYKTNVSVSYLDIRTGFKIWFLTVYCGIGSSSTAGESSFRVVRAGSLRYPGDRNADYYVDLNGKTEDSLRMVHYLAGVKIGGFTIHGSSTTRPNELTDTMVYSVQIGFTYHL